VVIPLGQCLARPGQPLVDHLTAVAEAMASAPQTPSDWLARLAGFLHDLGKARATWQRYLQAKLAGRSAEPVPHAYFGAAILAPLGQELLRHLSAWDTHRGEWLRWILDVADHHGELGDVEETPPWQRHWRLDVIADVDWPGVAAALLPHLPPTMPVPDWLRDGQAVFARVAEVGRQWRRMVEQWRNDQVDWLATARGWPPLAEACFREPTSRLIAADRFDSGHVKPEAWRSSQAEQAIQALDDHIARNRNGTEMDALRQRVRELALQAWRKNPDAPFYALTLPTGYGKTLTALRIALEAVRQGRARRIVYVAPHISILSQAAREIARACRMEVLEHHHLAVTLNEEMDDAAYLAMESWQAPVVATTFHQLFRALFPCRAQHTLRLPALEDAVVILDEPQMLDPRVWNVLLLLLEAAHRKLGTQVLLVTATLPTTRYAGVEVVPLTPAEQVPVVSRYRLTVHPDPLDEERLAELMLRKAREVGQVGVICNTVVDALRVYRLVREHADVPTFFVHGMLQPIHKQIVLDALSKHLSDEHPVIVVGTPILECGLNLSFRFLWRALPTLPAVVQSAGRVNRHGKQDHGEVWVAPFWRGGERSTREWLYQRREERDVTDELLARAPGSLAEPDVLALMREYYEEVFARNNHLAYCERLKQGILGRWSEVAGLKPFEDTVPTVTVFVPTGEHWLTEKQRQQFLEQWGCRSADELYERYCDSKWMSELDFLMRKRFLAALQAFSVPVVATCAQRVAAETERGIARCADTKLYDEELGFAGLRDVENAKTWIW